jgi:hypothetical protein
MVPDRAGRQAGGRLSGKLLGDQPVDLLLVAAEGVRGCPKRKRGDKMKGRKDFCERITRYNSWFSHREKRTKRT